MDRPSTPTGSASQSNPLLTSPTSSRRTKKKVIYSDRYIPSRTGVDLQAAFTLNHDSPSSNLAAHTSMMMSSSSYAADLEVADSELDSLKIQEANRNFDAVLKSELFGDRPQSIPSQQATPPGSMGSIGSMNSAASIVSMTPDSVTNSSPSRDTASSIPVPRTPRQNRNMFTYQSPSKSRPSSSSLTVNNELYSLSPVGASSERILLSPQRKPRAIPKVPYRVLDAPELADDFYLNLVDWGSQDILAVGLGSSVYLWDASTGSVNRLCDLGPSDSVTSLSWIGAGTHLAVGTNSGIVEIWDASACKCTRTMTGHASRASSLAWNRHILTSGSRDRTILHRDVREPAHYMKRLEYHKQEVCGLRWNVEENKLASGGNDNKLFVWDGVEDRPLYKFTEHQAAVKAIAWSPHQRGILASGGGTADRRIKIWNTVTGLKVHDVDTGSQVCNLAWSKTSNELVSTHGYSRNQIVIWKYSTMQQIASLTGHTYRVLYLAMSPDGQTIVTGAGDETLRFWNVFEKNKNEHNTSSVLLDSFMQLR
ncbi:hypothetical protein FOA43_003017 [Brettanomyces nanus]|uniref:CDC20/Fizzy WD40 domain-containing protein n=1 Tax=Eeniella nana TaxID=13502 RepID=A0A875S7H1_EENNA|nr:uncharacterized protein FOA43_003017 [Brettanomyces nanus]QPG75659.1 hypothetical protein FOA43_003017 [Brettanomyces nanus]